MLPVVAVVLAALCFATVGTAPALTDVTGSPLSIGAARLLIGGTIVALVALVARSRQVSGSFDSDRFDGRASTSGERSGRTGAASVTGLDRLPAWVLVGAGAAGMLVFQPTFFGGARLNGVAIGTVVAIGSAPILTGVLDAAIRRRIPTVRWGVATAITLVGVVLVSGVVGSDGVGTVHPLGILTSMGAGASLAVYAVASKILLDRGWSVTTTVGAIFGVAAVLSLPVLLVTPTAWLFTPEGVMLTLWLALVTTVLAYLLLGWALARLSPTTVTTLGLAEPVGATLLGVLVLHEQLSAVSIIGLIVIVVGLVILSIPARRAVQGVVSLA